MLPSAAYKGAGEAMTAGFGVRLDVLVAGDAVSVGDQAKLGEEPAVNESAEPRSVPGLGHRALGGDPRLQERRLAARLALAKLRAQLRCLPPVVVTGKHPVGGGLIRVSRLMHGRCDHYPVPTPAPVGAQHF